MAVDELARRRFERIANRIAKNESVYEEAMRDLNGAIHMLEIDLIDYLDNLERVTGVIPETKRIREEIEHAWKIFNDMKLIPAVDAVLQTFSEASVSLAQLIGALDRNSD